MLTSKAFFHKFFTRKKYGVPSHNFVKKMFCAKKVTKLPDLTVFHKAIYDELLYTNNY
jgi:hypothetical protein